jgi:drug/metabolite transporter (DMT)-like permease
LMPQAGDMAKKTAGVYISVVAANVLWSLTFVWFKIANESYGPFAIVFLRLLISAILLLAISWFIAALQKMDKKDVIKFLILAFIYPFLYFIAESTGLTMVSATQAAVIISTIPLVVPVGAYIFLNERVTILNVAGILISFTGVIIVVMKKDFTFDAPPAGILLMLAAVLAAVGYTLMVKRLTEKYNAFTITTYQNIFGSLLFLPLFFIFEYKGFLSSDHSVEALFNVGYLAVFGSSIAFIFFNYGVKVLGATKTETFANIIPVLTALFAFFMLGEDLGFRKLSGIAVVLTGLFLSQLRARKRPYDHLVVP